MYSLYLSLYLSFIIKKYRILRDPWSTCSSVVNSLHNCTWSAREVFVLCFYIFLGGQTGLEECVDPDIHIRFHPLCVKIPRFTIVHMIVWHDWLPDSKSRRPVLSQRLSLHRRVVWLRVWFLQTRAWEIITWEMFTMFSLYCVREDRIFDVHLRPNLCLLWTTGIARAKENTYKWVSVQWKTKS